MAGVVRLQAGVARVLFSASLRSIPESLIEAARLEGASHAQIFFRIVAGSLKE
jgi:alpha-glucoside transport system permease protein